MAIYMWREEQRNYAMYEFPNWTYPWWTIINWSFAQWALWSWWITAGASSTNCRMYVNMEWRNEFKIQHRCRYNTWTYWWATHCCISQDTNRTARTSITYSCNNSNKWISGQILGSDAISKTTFTAGVNYIDEIVYDWTTYTLNLYEDNDGEPWTLLLTGSADWANPNKYLILYHEHATTPFSQTNRVKVWYK
jgi:hypothetical protein